MFNKAILIGRMTADPELKQTGTGVYVVGFSIAVDRRYSSGGERKADFISIVAWRQQAEFICKYFHKGDPIGIDGSIQTRNYQDKTGAKRTVVEVVADNVFFTAPKGSSSTQAADMSIPNVTYSNGAFTDFEEVETDDDLPF